MFLHRPQVDSIGANLTTTSDGLAHLTWVDGGQEVRYGFGRGVYWPDPVTVARAAALASGPRILSERSERLHIAWDEGDMVLAASATPATLNWPKPSVITAPLSTSGRCRTGAGTGNEVSVGWIQTHQPQDVGIYESWQDLGSPASRLVAPHHALNRYLWRCHHRRDQPLPRVSGTS